MTTLGTEVSPPAQVDLNQDFFTVTAQDDGPVNWARYYDESKKPVADLDLRGNKTVLPYPAACDHCPHFLGPSLEQVSIRRNCDECGRLQFEISRSSAIGPTVRKGEDIVIPSMLFRRNLSLTYGASFNERGVDWLARQLFPRPIGLIPKPSHFQSGLRMLMEEAEVVLQACPLLSGIDRSTIEGYEVALKLLMEHKADPAFVAMILKTKAEFVADNVGSTPGSDDPTSLAMGAWSAGVAAAILRFKMYFEEAAYRGNTFEKIRWMISEWERNKINSLEAFWQELLLTRPFALSQLFAAPVVIHGERFLVGGMRAGGGHGKISDYLLKNKLTDVALIVEIKVPTASLLYEGEYRQDVYAPSRELSGAIQQVLEQRSQFMKQMQSLQAELEPDEPRIEIVEPHCAVIIGNTEQLDTRARRRSFEQYRTELRNVRVVTFDELFAKLEALATLLGATNHQAERPMPKDGL